MQMTMKVYIQRVITWLEVMEAVVFRLVLSCIDQTDSDMDARMSYGRPMRPAESILVMVP